MILGLRERARRIVSILVIASLVASSSPQAVIGGELAQSAALASATAPSAAEAGQEAKGVIPKDIITDEGVLLRFDQVDITNVIELYSRITDRIVIPLPEVRGKLTIINRKRVSRAKAAELIESAMELQGWTVLPEGDVTKIIKSKDAIKRLTPMVTPRSEESLRGVNRMQTHLVPLHCVKGEEVKSLLTPLLSADGTIQVNDRTNLMVITEVGTNMAKLLELLERVDRPLSASEETRLKVPVKTMAPKRMMEILQGYYKNTAMRILDDDRLGVLILTGTKRDLDDAVSMIEMLDVPVPKDQTTNQIMRIQYAKAAEVATLIEKLYKGRAVPPPLTFSVNADVASNSLILTGPTELREEIAALIARIDIRYQQVLLRCLIGELNDTPNSTLGVQWSHLVGSSSEFSQDFGAIGQSADRANVRTSTVGLRYSLLRPDSYSTFISALQTKQVFNTLASPQISVSSNKPAEFFVGSKVPVQTSERISTGNDIVRSNEFVEVGLTLKVTPSITANGDVAMDLDLKFSQQTGKNPGFINPIFSNRAFKSNVIVHDEDTLVIAGLMNTADDRTVTQVPVLGDIPLLGRLFQKHSDSKVRQELLVLLTPSVMNSQEDANRVLNIVEKKAFQDEKKFGVSFRNAISDIRAVNKGQPEAGPGVDSRVAPGLRCRRPGAYVRVTADGQPAAPVAVPAERPVGVSGKKPAEVGVMPASSPRAPEVASKGLDGGLAGLAGEAPATKQSERALPDSAATLTRPAPAPGMSAALAERLQALREKASACRPVIAPGSM